MHRLKRQASIDATHVNSFIRVREHHRATNFILPKNASPTELSSVEEETPSSVGGPTRTNTLRIEEGESEGRHRQSYRPEKEEVQHKNIPRQLKTALFNSWVNILLVFIPVGIAARYAGLDQTIVFTMNLIAIIPLAALIGQAAEEIELYSGEVVGALIDTSFGNAVKIIISILALLKGDTVITKTSLIGSMLSNLILVLGVAFIAGGYNRYEQSFNGGVARTISCILALAVGSLIFPSAFYFASSTGEGRLAELSHGTSIILLLVYGCYLYFQLKTHSSLYSIPSQKAPKKNTFPPAGESLVASSGIIGITIGTSTTDPLIILSKRKFEDEDKDEEAKEPDLALWVNVVLLIFFTAIATLCAEFLVGSINHFVTSTGVSRVFIGLVLLPMVGNEVEHPTAISVAARDKMDLTIGLTVGSSMQTALLVIPFVVILGWILGVEGMTLYFDGFQVLSLVVSVLLINFLLHDGKSNYLKGVLLVTLYIIIAIAAWFY